MEIMVLIGRVIALFLCLFSGSAAWSLLFVITGMIATQFIDGEWWNQYGPIALLAGYPVIGGLMTIPGAFRGSVEIKIGARKPSDREQQQLDLAKDRLSKEYEMLNGQSLPNLTWSVVDVDELNAMAFPDRWIVVTRKLLEFVRENEENGEHLLYGVLAHEIGHIHHGDASQVKWMQCLTWPLEPYIWMARLFVAVFSILGSIPILGIAFLIFYWLFIAMTWCCLLPQKIAWFIQSMTGKANEWRADRFAFDMHGGRGLRLFLEAVSGEDVYTGGTIMDHYQRSHPPVELRLNRLEQLSKEAELGARQPS